MMGVRARQGLLVLAAGLMLLAGSAFPAMAGEWEDQLSDVESRISKARGTAAEAEAVIRAVSLRLAAIRQELAAAEDALRQIRASQETLRETIRKTGAELAEAERALRARQDVLARRIRAVYIHGRLSYLEVLLGAKSFRDFANRVEFLKRIIRADIALLLEIREKKEAVLAKREQLEEEKRRLDALEADAAKNEAAISAKKEEQQQALEDARQHKAAAEALEERLQAESQSIRDAIRQREEEARRKAEESGGGSAPQETRGSGVLSWPCEGPITSPFGYRIHPIFGTRIFHSGIDIGVDEGTPIHAADSGTVSYAGWMTGYGNVIILDHGNGMQTVYAHNSSFVKSEGDAVAKGDVISYSGQTGYATGPHLHFEVRIRGEVVDPMGYL